MKRKVSLKLVREAHEHGRKAARKANGGEGLDKRLSELPKPVQVGFTAMAQFILDHHQKP